MRNKSREAFRNEWKYLISTSEKEMLMLRLKPFLQPDPHAGEGGYYIRSLYFEDYWNSAYAEKEAGVLMRKKYRIRIYNNNDKFIKLERKKKFGSYIYKESAPLTREEVEKILKGDYAFLLYSPHSLCREFYIECTCNMMRPRTIVDYERIPWILDAGTVRITFDSDVRAAIVCAGTWKTDSGSEVYRNASPAFTRCSATASSGIYSSFQICTLL